MADEPTALDLEIVRRLAPATGDGSPVSPALARLLISDGLTGLHNRAYFQERLQHELSVASPERSLTLFIIDLDHFKEFNDRYGHRVGDLALQEVARVMRAMGPPGCAPCRLGGDEFALLVPGMARAEATVLQAELTQAIARREIPLGEGQEPLHLAGSVGLATAPADGQDAENLFHRADAAMYGVKRRPAGARGPGAAQAHGPFPLVGRDGLLGRAPALLAAAESGQGQMVLLSGPPGVGKSRVAAEIAESARTRGWLVLTSPVPMGHGRPLHAIRQLAAQLLRVVGGRHLFSRVHPRRPVNLLVHLIQATQPPELIGRPTTAQLAVGLQHLLTQAAAQRPVLWLVDDLMMADSATMAIIGHLAGVLPGLRLLFLAVGCTEGAWEAEQRNIVGWWERVGQQDGCRRWEVPPLDPNAAAELAGQALAAAGMVADPGQIGAAAGGNPLAIMELAGTPDLVAADEAASPAAAPARIWTLSEIYAAFWDGLPEQTQSVLASAAVLGQEVPVAALMEVAPEPPDAARHSLDALVQVGWLERTARQRVRFSHHLGRETVYQQMPVALRRTLHRLAYRTLMRMPGPSPLELARHSEEGGDWTRAQGYHQAAGQAADAVFAHIDAAHHFRRSLHLGESANQVGSDASAVATTAADLFWHVGEAGAAQEMLQYALQNSRTAAQRGRALSKLAEVHVASGRLDLVRALNTEALRGLRAARPSADLAGALVRQVWAEARSGNRSAARAVAREALRAVQAVGDPAAATGWLASVGAHLCLAQDHKQAAQCLRRAEASLRALKRERTAQLAGTVAEVATLARRLGQLPRAVLLFRLAERLAAANAETPVQMRAALGAAESLLASGDAAATRTALAALDPLLQVSGAALDRCRALAVKISLGLASGDLTDTERHLILLRHSVRSLDPLWARYAAALEALWLLTRGAEPATASWTPADLLALPVRDELATPVLVAAAQVQLAAGDRAAAQALVNAAREHLVDQTQLSSVDWVQGSVHLASGRRGSAQTTFRRAAAAPGSAYHRALAHRDLVALMLKPTRRPDAQQVREGLAHLEAARRLCGRLENRTEGRRLAALHRPAAERAAGRARASAAG